MVPTCFLLIIPTRKGKGDTQYGTQKKSRREKQKPRKNRPPLAKQRVVGTGPRRGRRRGTGERPRCSRLGRTCLNVLCRLLPCPPRRMEWRGSLRLYALASALLSTFADYHL